MHSSVFYKREAEADLTRAEEKATWKQSRDRFPDVGLEEWSGAAPPRNARALKNEKGQGTEPRASGRREPYDTLILVHSYSISGLQTHESLLCCFNHHIYGHLLLES